jgi:hypothetical protein
MKTSTIAEMLLAATMIFTGCASPQRGDAYGHEQEFRRQLAKTDLVREHGYGVKDLRFSADYKKALVVFADTDSKARPDLEVVLTADDFGRYQGRVLMQPFHPPQATTPLISIVMPRSK